MVGDLRRRLEAKRAIHHELKGTRGWVGWVYVDARLSCQQYGMRVYVRVSKSRGG